MNIIENKAIMPVGGKKGRKGSNKGKKGGAHTAKKTAEPAKNHLLNPVKMTTFKAPVAKKAQVVKTKDAVMGNTGTRQSARASTAPKKLEVSFKKTAPKSSYVPISDIPKRIEEYEKLIESKKKEIEKYEAKIAELKNKQLDHDTKASNMDALSNLMSGFRF